MVLWVMRSTCRHVDHDELGILDCRDPDDSDIVDGSAVARIDPHAVDVDRAGGGHEVAMPLFAERVFDGLADLQRGAQHTCAGPDRQCVVVAVEAARERHQAPGTVGFGKGSRPPSGRAAIGFRGDPDLKKPRRLMLQIVFGVADPAAGAHHLHVSGFGSTLVAEAVLVRHRTFADVGDDFHVGVWVRRKARVGRDLIVVPDAERAPPHSRRIAIVGEGKVVLGLQPAVICSCELVEWSAFDHRRSPGQWPVLFRSRSMDTARN